MRENLLAFLETAIKHIQVDTWGKRGAPVVSLSEDTYFDLDENRLYGAIKIMVPSIDGHMKLLHTEIISGSKTIEEVQDHLSNGLSIVLSKHPRWFK